MQQERPPQVSQEIWNALHLRAMPFKRGFMMYWLGQSGYAIRAYDRMLVIDPYLSDSLTKKYANTPKPHVRMHPIWLPPHLLGECLGVVLSTHQHTDHLDPETLTPLFAPLIANHLDVPLIAPEACRAIAAERSGLYPSAIVGMDAGSLVQVGEFKVSAVPAAHPTLERNANGHLTCLGYVIEVGDYRIYHSGDTLVYEGMAEIIRKHEAIDVAILPINGKVGNMGGRDAARLAKEIGARVVIPCHYDMFEFNTADPQAEFVPECERIGQRYRVLQLGERFSSSEIG